MFQRLALLRQGQQTQPAILISWRLTDIALIDQRVQNARQGLLGDAQDCQQAGHGDAGLRPMKCSAR